MKKQMKILVPTDFSNNAKQALRYALHYAQKTDATVHVFHVVYPEYEAADIPVFSAITAKDKIEMAKKSMAVFIDTVITQVTIGQNIEGIPVITSNIGTGLLTDAIYYEATDENADIIIMGTQGQHNTLEKVFGSVSAGMIRKSPCPVLVIPEGIEFKSIEKIAYASDLRDTDPLHIWESVQAVKPYQPKLFCVHVEPEAVAENPYTEMDLQKLEGYCKTTLPDVEVSVHNIIGDSVSDAINDFLYEKRIDMLFMHAPERGFFNRLFHRSETRKMALNSHVPLFVMK